MKVLVGNKCDKEREIPLHVANYFAQVNNFDMFLETSALEAENIETLFYEIAKILVNQSQSSSKMITSQNEINLGSNQKCGLCASCS